MIKLTKNELRDQQSRLSQLEKYLPTLQLKKAMLQIEVNNTQIELQDLEEILEKSKERVVEFSSLLAEKVDCDVCKYAEVVHVNKSYENIAGVEIPTFQSVVFKEEDYSLFDTPSWTDSALLHVRKMVSIIENIHVVNEKKRALEKELREVSIRVNLFEKVLIPRAKQNIKKIKIFLGDQQLAAVSQAKVAKMKILQRKSA